MFHSNFYYESIVLLTIFHYDYAVRDGFAIMMIFFNFNGEQSTRSLSGTVIIVSVARYRSLKSTVWCTNRIRLSDGLESIHCCHLNDVA
jgi:hypothetical protein